MRRWGCLAVLLAVAAMPTGALAENADDALAAYDEAFLGATLTDACNPGFDWSTSKRHDGEVAQRAYDALLVKVHEVDPGGNNDEGKASMALELRSRKLLRQGKAMVAAKGCGDPEIQRRVHDFAASAH
jgi:hypothetical protein